MNNKIVVALSLITGILFLAISLLYFALPASHLPHFLPGYSASLARHHFTHGVASLFLGLLAFAFAWFTSGKKSN